MKTLTGKTMSSDSNTISMEELQRRLGAVLSREKQVQEREQALDVKTKELHALQGALTHQQAAL